MHRLLLASALLFLLSACGGTKKNQPELPDSAWPELSHYLEATAVIDQTVDGSQVLDVFQSSMSAAHVLLQGSIPRNFKTPQVEALLSDLSEHQVLLQDLSNLNEGTLLKYRSLAHQLQKETGMVGL